MWATTVLVFCRWAVGLTFAASALGKATAMDVFRDSVHDLGGVPGRRVPLVASAVVALETLAAVLMLLGRPGAVAGFVLATGLLVVFTAVLVRALTQRRQVSCNCFGRQQRRISWYDVGRNGALLAVCVGGMVAAVVVSGRGPDLALLLVLGLMAAVYGLLATGLEDVVDTLRGPRPEPEAGR